MQHSVNLGLPLAHPDPLRIAAYGQEATIIDGLPARMAAPLRDAVLQACVAHTIVVGDVVVGARSVVVTHDSRDARRVRDVLEQCALQMTQIAAASSVPQSPLVEIAVRYDGDDLHAVAEHTGLRVREVIELHSNAQYEVEFCGFAPGFAYLVGLPAILHVPRRTTPRPKVPPGAVAIANAYTAVYPRESPGGWHLVGVTTHEMWNLQRTTPAALTPGMRVRFREVS